MLHHFTWACRRTRLIGPTFKSRICGILKALSHFSFLEFYEYLVFAFLNKKQGQTKIAPRILEISMRILLGGFVSTVTFLELL
jgi:hypothetical protein